MCTTKAEISMMHCSMDMVGRWRNSFILGAIVHVEPETVL